MDRSSNKVGTEFAVWPFCIGVLATASYWPGVTGGPINTVWVSLSLALAFASRFTYPVKSACIIGAILCACFVRTQTGAEALWHYAVVGLAVAFAFEATLDDMEAILYGATAGLFISLITAAFYYFGHPIVYQQPGALPSGLFANSMYFGIVSALLVVACCQFCNVWLACVPLIGVAIVGSRTGWGVLLIAALHWAWRKERDLFLAALPAMVLIVGTVVWFKIAGRPVTLSERLDLWQSVVSQLTWFGHGIGAASLFRGAEIEHAYSAALQVVFELGIFAVPVLGWLAWRRANALLLSSLFVVVTCEAMQQPSIAFLCAIALGDALKFRDCNGVAGAERGPDTGAGVSHAQREADRNGGVGVSVQRQHQEL